MPDSYNYIWIPDMSNASALSMMSSLGDHHDGGVSMDDEFDLYQDRDLALAWVLR